jgi:hypothetical protein
MGAPQIDPATIAQQLANLSRSPFRDQVLKFLINAPSDQAIAFLAEKNPDRWAQALAIVARLGGYNEKLEVEASVSMSINAMSDAELAAEIAALKPSLDGSSNGDPLK